MLKTPRKERFAQLLALGKGAIEAYALAGYSDHDPRGRNAFKLRREPAVKARVEELMPAARRFDIEHQANERAIRQLALSKEAVARELANIGFANITNYTRLQGDVRVPDFSYASFEQMAAVTEITVEYWPPKLGAKQGRKGSGAKSALADNDTVVSGPRDHEPRIRRVKVKLGDKRAALMDLAKLFGWNTDPPKAEPPTPLEQRLRAMTPEQRRQDAKDLHARIRERLKELPPSAVEPEAEELETSTANLEGGIGEEGNGK